MLVTDSVDVLVASLASGAAAAKSANNDRFNSRRSGAASMAQVASAAPSGRVCVRSLPSSAAGGSAKRRFDSSMRSVLSRSRVAPARASSDGSMSVTVAPACSSNCAIPRPMVPAPTTATDWPPSGRDDSAGRADGRAAGWAGSFTDRLLEGFHRFGPTTASRAPARRGGARPWARGAWAASFGRDDTPVGRTVPARGNAGRTPGVRVRRQPADLPSRSSIASIWCARWSFARVSGCDSGASSSSSMRRRR